MQRGILVLVVQLSLSMPCAMNPIAVACLATSHAARMVAARQLRRWVSGTRVREAGVRIGHSVAKPVVEELGDGEEPAIEARFCFLYSPQAHRSFNRVPG